MNNPIVESEDSDNKISKNRTLFDVSKKEILWRNFLAGIGRALGSLFVYSVVLVILGWLFSNFLLPQLQPFIETFRNLPNLPQNLR